MRKWAEEGNASVDNLYRGQIVVFVEDEGGSSLIPPVRESHAGYVVASNPCLPGSAPQLRHEENRPVCVA